MQTLDFGLTSLSMQRSSSPFSLGTLPGLRVWYNPSDISSLFQDAAMTIPVTADGERIGAILDKSGNGFHALQTDPSKRPTYRHSQGKSWVEFDGSSSSLSASGLSMAGSDEVLLAAAVETTAETAIGVVCELSASSVSNQGTFALFDRGVGSGTVSWRSRGSNNSILTAPRGASIPVASTYVCTGKISTDHCMIRRNGTEIGTSSSDQGTGTFTVDTFYLGAREGLIYHFTGKLFGLCLSSDLSSLDSVTKIEGYLSSQMS